MDYLELCQTVRQECGASGNGPSSVVSQTGESLRLVNWVRRAWLKVQTFREDWNWMRSVYDGPISDSIVQHPSSGYVASRFGHWLKENLRVYTTADGIDSGRPLHFLPYNEFVRRYVFTTSANGFPVHYSIAPNGDLMLGPPPDTGMSAYLPYQKSAQTLSANTDVPELPEDNQWIIVYEAMKYYARREASPEIMDDANVQYELELNRLERTQLPEVNETEETLA